MHPIYNTYCPDGFGTMSPYLFVTDGLANTSTFFKKHSMRKSCNHMSTRKQVLLANAIVKIEEIVFMVSEGRDGFAGMHASLLYVNDVDALHAHAVEAGCLCI